MPTAPRILIGCAGLPAGLHRDRYFEKLRYLELGETFSKIPKAKSLKKWVAPEGSVCGVLANQRITHSANEGNYAATPLEDAERHEVGGFRDTETIRKASTQLLSQVETLAAGAVVFRSSPSFSASAQNRDRLRRYFGEIAPAEAFGEAIRVWEPGTLWETEPAVSMAEELGLVLAVDALAENPRGGSAPRPVDLVPREIAYLRQRGLGRSKGFRPHELEELAELANEFGRAFVVFAHPDKNRDAKALSQLLSELPSQS